MTVKELQEALADFPDDRTVWRSASEDDDLWPIETVSTETYEGGEVVVVLS